MVAVAEQHSRDVGHGQSDEAYRTAKGGPVSYTHLPYPKSPITYVTEYPATHFLRDTFRGLNVIVQEQQAVHDTLLHGNGTKRQRPETGCASMADMPASFP